MTRLRDTIYHTHQALAATYEDQFRKAKIDLTPQQFAVLEAMWDQNGPSQTMLVEITGIDRSTMADIVRRLMRKGFISRKRSSKDARRNILSITTSGKEVTLRAQIIANSIEANLPVKGLDTKLKAIIGSVGTGQALVAAE